MYPFAIVPHKLMTCLIFATSLHAITILGISLYTPLKKPEITSPKMLEITLAHQPTKTPPEAAQFLAQIHQLGSGDAEVIAEPKVKEHALFPDVKVRPVNTTPATDPLAPKSIKSMAIITTDDTINTLISTPEHTESLNKNTTSGSMQPPTFNRSQAIATLTAQLETQHQLMSNRPRRRHISAATHQSRDAHYLDNWRKHIETIGNIHYPSEAKQRQLTGELRLLVALNTDGTINEISIRKSSGHHILDDAAIAIVNLAAPFQPLTKEMSQDTDILEIIRTWQFNKSNRLQSSG